VTEVSTRQLDELLDVIEQLRAFLRVATFDEDPGEREADDRTEVVLARYRPAA
jgi:hypothetical protein